ncbi:MAG: hypothetical protein SGI73_02405 [Chloroflexota bacterium]|nr:hypothetical protein [Chloroflexota bacterium]
MRAIFRLAWHRFGLITAALGDMQGRAIATIFYYTVLAPFGLFATSTRDLLDLKSKPAWGAREPVDSRLDGAKRQG